MSFSFYAKKKKNIYIYIYKEDNGIAQNNNNDLISHRPVKKKTHPSNDTNELLKVPRNNTARQVIKSRWEIVCMQPNTL